MDIPKITRRISDFLMDETGKISKQSLLSVGALLSAAAIGALTAKPVRAADVERGCPPGVNSQAWSDTALTGQNAYNPDGTQRFFGTGRCSDDGQLFHFNGADMSYSDNVLTAQHHHHGSHNSY
jgi:hypothetical protein